MEERIKGMYNDCWIAYKKYLETHNMGQYNKDCKELMEKYDNQVDICNLLFWWAPRVQTLHERYTKGDSTNDDH